MIVGLLEHKPEDAIPCLKVYIQNIHVLRSVIMKAFQHDVDNAHLLNPVQSPMSTKQDSVKTLTVPSSSFIILWPSTFAQVIPRILLLPFTAR